MKAPVIVVQLTETKLGLYAAKGPFGRPFLFGDSGTPAKNISSNQELILCRYSVLPALSLDGILSVDIVEGSFDQSSFASFIDGLLNQMNQFPAKNSVIVMDNCRIHHAEFILNMIIDRYVSNLSISL
jgi:hypothetical protein